MQATMTASVATCIHPTNQRVRELIHACMDRYMDGLMQGNTREGLHAWFRACFPGNEAWVDEWMDAH
jgi:hypothetical protein